MPRIFVSYSHVDTEKAKQVIDQLRRVYAPNNVWYDDQLHAGLDWQQEILKQVANCDVLVYLLSNESITSPACQKEFAEAKRLQKPCVSVLIRDRTNLSSELARIQYVDMKHGIDADNIARLFRSINEEFERLKKAPDVIQMPSVPFDEIAVGQTKKDVLPVQLPENEEKPIKDGRRGRAVLIGALIGIILISFVLSRAIPLIIPSPTSTTLPPTETIKVTSVPTEELAPTPTIPPLPSTSVTSNDQWQPYIQQYAHPINGIDMVLVPIGCFRMGDASDAVIRDGEEQCIDRSFYISRNEITNEEFTSLSCTTTPPRPSHWSEPQRPREMITWIEATRCAEQMECRLPTEKEWEYAARGPDSLIYPWGDEWPLDSASDFNYLIFPGNSRNQTANVGGTLDGVSWIGAYDMVGNVWEWTSTIYEGYPYVENDGRENNIDLNSPRVLRGGSWFNVPSNAKSAYRLNYPPDTANFDFGFRIACPA
jgi:formylglycine-generating enzyme